MGLERQTCCGALTRTYSDTVRKHYPGCRYATPYNTIPRPEGEEAVALDEAFAAVASRRGSVPGPGDAEVAQAVAEQSEAALWARARRSPAAASPERPGISAQSLVAYIEEVTEEYRMFHRTAAQHLDETDPRSVAETVAYEIVAEAFASLSYAIRDRFTDVPEED